MRRGTKEAQIITIPSNEPDSAGRLGGQIIGLSLGWDFVSEHEWGFHEIRQAFGMPDELNRRNIGADFRSITKCPEGFMFFNDLGGCAYLMYERYLKRDKPEKITGKYLDKMLRKPGYPEEDLSTAWDESSFGVRLKNDELFLGNVVLGQIYEAFLKCDGMVFLGGQTNSFGNHGLVLSIRSRMPKDVLEKMKESDTDYLDLNDAVKQTGIKQKLQDAGKRYFALSPRWSALTPSIKTEHSVVFWLNPQEQEKNNFGWYSVEDLLEWIEGKGRIPISKS